MSSKINHCVGCNCLEKELNKIPRNLPFDDRVRLITAAHIKINPTFLEDIFSLVSIDGDAVVL